MLRALQIMARPIDRVDSTALEKSKKAICWNNDEICQKGDTNLLNFWRDIQKNLVVLCMSVFNTSLCWFCNAAGSLFAGICTDKAAISSLYYLSLDSDNNLSRKAALAEME